MHEWIFGKCLAEQRTKNKTKETQRAQKMEKSEAMREQHKKKYGEMLLAHIWTHSGLWYVAATICRSQRMHKGNKRTSDETRKSHFSPIFLLGLLRRRRRRFVFRRSCADAKWNPWKIGHFEFGRKMMANGSGEHPQRHSNESIFTSSVVE